MDERIEELKKHGWELKEYNSWESRSFQDAVKEVEKFFEENGEDCLHSSIRIGMETRVPPHMYSEEESYNVWTVHFEYLVKT